MQRGNRACSLAQAQGPLSSRASLLAVQICCWAEVGLASFGMTQRLLPACLPARRVPRNQGQQDRNCSCLPSTAV